MSKRLSRRNLLPWLQVELERLPPGAAVLNVGADGETAALARTVAGARGLDLINTDIDPDCAPDQVDDITNSALSDARFDAVMIAEVLEHVEDPRAAVAEIMRVLRPGGVLIASTPFIYPLHARPTDFWRFTRYGLALLLRDFEAVDIRERNGWAEALLTAQGRLVLELGRGPLLAAAMLVPLAAVMAGPARWLQRRAPSDFLTSGYVVTARRPRA